MKLIIDISEEVYKQIKGSNTIFRDDEKMCYEAVQNGTQLPKGHGRLIDADVLADGFEDNFEFCEVVNATPTIIEADKGDRE